MQKPLLLTALTGLIALSACGGTTGGSPTLFATSGSAGPVTSSGSIPTSGPINNIVTINGTLISGLTRFTSVGTYGGASITAVDGATYNVLIYADDGKVNGTSTPFITTDVYGSSAASQTNAFNQSANYARVNVSLLPTSGGASYSGDYRGTYGSPTGMVGGSAANGSLIGVEGTINMTANLDTKNISGTITNRQARLATGLGLGFDNVTLNIASYGDNGIYSGTTSGGTYSGNGMAAQNGTYEGVIGGNNGSNVGGVLYIPSNGGFSEVGAFTAVRVP